MEVPPVASRQAGVFTRKQAAAAGFTRSAIRARLRSGRWRTVVGEVLTQRDGVVATTARAWTAHLATGGVVSHWTAGAVHGFVDDDLSLHVVSPPRVHVRIPEITEHRVRLGADEVIDRGGLPITSRLRTVVDLLAYAKPQQARTLLFRSVQQGWLSQDALREQIGRRRNMTGTNQLRDLVELLGTGAHSVAERGLHQVLATIPGLPFEANAALTLGGSRYVVDVLVADHGLVVEVDGRRFHSGADQFAQDRRRQNALVLAGYTVLRFTWIELIERPRRVRADVLAAISVSSGRWNGLTGP